VLWFDNCQTQITIDLRFDIEMGSDHAANFILSEESFNEGWIDLGICVHMASRQGLWRWVRHFLSEAGVSSSAFSSIQTAVGLVIQHYPSIRPHFLCGGCDRRVWEVMHNRLRRRATMINRG